jgi:hypothetical protein
VLFHTITALIEADLNPALRGRPVSIAYLERPSPGTILMAHDDAGLRWVFGTGYRPDQDPLEGFTDQRVAELVRAAAGLPDLEVRLHPQIPGTDLKVLGFTIGAQLAHSYRAGQVFLVGDATCTAASRCSWPAPPAPAGPRPPSGSPTGWGCRRGPTGSGSSWPARTWPPPTGSTTGQSAAFVDEGLPDDHDRTAPASRVPASRHRPVPGGRQRQGVLAAMPPGRPGGMLGVKDVRMHRNQTRR